MAVACRARQCCKNALQCKPPLLASEASNLLTLPCLCCCLQVAPLLCCTWAMLQAAMLAVLHITLCHDCRCPALSCAGGTSAVLELGDAKKPLVSWGGFTSWVAWRRYVQTHTVTISDALKKTALPLSPTVTTSSNSPPPALPCSAYLTRLGTLKHRAYVAGDWTLTLLFGRDISRW